MSAHDGIITKRCPNELTDAHLYLARDWSTLEMARASVIGAFLKGDTINGSAGSATVDSCRSVRENFKNLADKSLVR